MCNRQPDVPQAASPMPPVPLMGPLGPIGPTGAPPQGARDPWGSPMGPLCGPASAVGLLRCAANWLVLFAAHLTTSPSSSMMSSVRRLRIFASSVKDAMALLFLRWAAVKQSVQSSNATPSVKAKACTGSVNYFAAVAVQFVKRARHEMPNHLAWRIAMLCYVHTYIHTYIHTCISHTHTYILYMHSYSYIYISRAVKMV